MIPTFHLGSFGMGRPAGVTDPYYSSVVALLHCDGTDASTTFTDQKGKTWTAAGNAQIDTAQSKFGGAAALFDGTGDRVTTPDHADFEFGTGDFTIEGWIRVSSIGVAQVPFGKRNAGGTYGGFMLYLTTLGLLNFYATSAGVSWDVINGGTCGTLSTNTWYHWAVSRNGTTFKGFLDGVEGFTTVSAGSIQDNAYSVHMGGDNDGTNSLNGWLDDVRVTKGVARYTGAFTPPTAAFPDA